MAEHVKKYNIDLVFPAIRSVSTAGELPSAYERLHWPLNDNIVAKLMRKANDVEGLNMVLEVMERQYNWFHCAREIVEMWRNVSPEHMSRGNNWFGWSATGWYEALLSAVVGVWEEPGGLVYIPAATNFSVKLSNLPYRGGIWNISTSGKGKWIKKFVVDSELVSGICKIPSRFYTEGGHTLEIEHTEALPSQPYIFDSTGLILQDSLVVEGKVCLSFSGPSRAFVKFYSPRNPEVIDGGLPVCAGWNSATGYGCVEISRTADKGELTIES